MAEILEFINHKARLTVSLQHHQYPETRRLEDKALIAVNLPLMR